MNNEEKILAILETMQADISDLKETQSSMQADINGLREDVDSVKNAVLLMENVHGEKLDALFDGYNQVYDVAKNIEHHIVKKDYTYSSRLVAAN